MVTGDFVAPCTVLPTQHHAGRRRRHLADPSRRTARLSQRCVRRRKAREEGHETRVTLLALETGEGGGLDRETRQRAFYAALLHDAHLTGNQNEDRLAATVRAASPRRRQNSRTNSVCLKAPSASSASQACL